MECLIFDNPEMIQMFAETCDYCTKIQVVNNAFLMFNHDMNINMHIDVNINIYKQLCVILKY